MGKTFSTLFSSFASNELCQLYIYPNIPNIDVCSSYYRITDKEVLKGLFTRAVTGRTIKNSEIRPEFNSFENAKDESFYRNKKNKETFRIIARDLLWSLSPWFNKDLKGWLVQQKITHIFVAAGRYKFIYDIALRISNYLKLPIVTYICDDFFFVKQKKSFADKIQDYLFKQKMKQLMQKTSAVVVISQELKDLYKPYFKKDVEVIMTGCSFPISKKKFNGNVITELTYMGSIRCNRYKSLCDIGNALDKINQECNKNYCLNIYSNEKDPIILGEIAKYKSLKMKGFVSGSAYDTIFHSAQCLLHVEAFDDESIDLVKKSISTKIADCLGSGIPFIAFGPSNIASISHLKRNNSAFLIEERDCLKQQLLQYLSMPKEERTVIVGNALATAIKCHDTFTNSKKLFQIIGSV